MTLISSSDIERGYTEVVVVRHGITAANAAGVLQGHLNSQLSPDGIFQAKQLAPRITTERFDVVYSSDLTRTRQTAEIITGGRDDINFVEELREWHLGELENITYSEARERFPEVMEDFKFDAPDIIIPNGESKKKFYDRIAAFLDQVADRHSGQKILLVTHGGVLQAMLKHALGSDNCWSFLPRSSNTGYNKFVRRDGVWQLCCWNDTSHITGGLLEL